MGIIGLLKNKEFECNAEIVLIHKYIGHKGLEQTIESKVRVKIEIVDCNNGSSNELWFVSFPVLPISGKLKSIKLFNNKEMIFYKEYYLLDLIVTSDYTIEKLLL